MGGHHLLQPPRLAGSNHGDTTLCHWHNRFFNRGKTNTLQSIFSVCISPQIYVISFFGDYWTKKHIFDMLFKGSEHLPKILFSHNCLNQGWGGTCPNLLVLLSLKK